MAGKKDIARIFSRLVKDEFGVRKRITDCIPIVDKFMAEVAELTKKENGLRLPEFGTFKVKHVEERRVRMAPLEGCPTKKIKAHNRVKFKPSPNFKKRVNTDG